MGVILSTNPRKKMENIAIPADDRLSVPHSNPRPINLKFSGKMRAAVLYLTYKEYFSTRFDLRGL